jgi:hypothetical protein
MKDNAPQRKEEDHAYQNAQAWAQSIAEMVAALECDYAELDALTEEGTACSDKPRHVELIAEATIDGYIMKDADEARDRIQQSPLSVEIRSGWTAPGEAMEAEDFCILLSTGGPALRIRGELNQHKEPDRAWLEYQDWGTPWTEYHGDGCEHETLLTFCRQFYFGE